MQVLRSMRNLTLIALPMFVLVWRASVRVFFADLRRSGNHNGSPGTAGLRAAALPATKLDVDSWILGMGWSRRLRNPLRLTGTLFFFASAINGPIRSRPSLSHPAVCPPFQPHAVTSIWSDPAWLLREAR